MTKRFFCVCLSDLLGAIIFRPEVDGGRGRWESWRSWSDNWGGRSWGVLCPCAPRLPVRMLGGRQRPGDVQLPPCCWRVSAEDEGLCSAGCPLCRLWRSPCSFNRRTLVAFYSWQRSWVAVSIIPTHELLASSSASLKKLPRCWSA